MKYTCHCTLRKTVHYSVDVYLLESIHINLYNKHSDEYIYNNICLIGFLNLIINSNCDLSIGFSLLSHYILYSSQQINRYKSVYSQYLMNIHHIVNRCRIGVIFTDYVLIKYINLRQKSDSILLHSFGFFF